MNQHGTVTRADERDDMRRTVAEFLDRYSDSGRVRAAMASEHGYDTALWRRCSQELGTTALVVPERCGGLGMGFADAAVVIEEFGRRVVPSPLLTTVVAAAAAAACDTGEADELLRVIAEEGAAVSIAFEGERPVRATRTGRRWSLRGRPAHVMHGADVDVLLVVAETGNAGDPALFVVRRAAEGVRADRLVTLDQTRSLAEVELAGARAVPLAGEGNVKSIVDMVTELTLIALAAESAAAARSCLEATVEYLKVRHQFGKPLGSFQALKHRCADLAVDVEGAESTAWYAVETALADPGERAVVAPLAKAVCADTFMRVAAESVQLHGGIGFTFEHDAHLFLKRAKANQHLLASPQELRRKVGEAAGL
ncbi:acyl-CoA dehydrogenase family protein [Saccharomonospora sp. NPDC006951]